MDYLTFPLIKWGDGIYSEVCGALFVWKYFYMSTIISNITFVVLVLQVNWILIKIKFEHY